MSRPALVALAVGLLGTVAGVALALSGTAVMPSYLGAWLFLLALPLGALPVVMTLELLDAVETRLIAMLRGLVAVMPLAALLSIPVLLGLGRLYPGLGTAAVGLPSWWMTPGFFVLRAVLFLGVWTALSVVFGRTATGRGVLDTRRPLLAGLGLGLHAVMGTLAADDWAQAVDPGFGSAVYGLVLMAAQVSLAVSLAVVLAATGRWPVAVGRPAAVALAVSLALWGFLVFTQYLVVWSANLPKEVVWYQHRSDGLGLPAEGSAGVICALALLALLPRGSSRHSGLVASVAAALVVMHGLEMLWLVTPAFRPGFVLLPADVLALAAASGLGIGAALLRAPGTDDRSETGRGRHGAA